MHGIAQDFVRYVMHVQVVQQPTEDAAAVQQPSLLDVATHSAEDVTTTALQAAAQQALAEGELSPEEMAPSAAAAPNGAPAAATRTKQQTVVKDEWSKTRSQRAVPLRVGQEVQDVPRSLTDA